MIVLLYLRGRRKFYGQLFLLYLIFYACGRIVIELFRGDEARGYIIDGYLSHSQFIALCIIAVVGVVYWRWSSQNPVTAKIKKRA
jgi:phosphatidylglycerol:prolipoprotein diacylglycerol transferase